MVTDLEQEIKEKLKNLPEGWTPEQLTKAMKEGQKSATLTEQSVDDFLKIFRSNEQSVIDRMTILDDDQLTDFYDAHLVNDMFYKIFCMEKGDKNIFTDFINGVARRYVSSQGRGLDAYENIAAGRAPGDVGLFRGIFGMLSKKLFKEDDKKI